jgi:hypothetical protein
MSFIKLISSRLNIIILKSEEKVQFKMKSVIFLTLFCLVTLSKSHSVLKNENISESEYNGIFLTSLRENDESREVESTESTTLSLNQQTTSSSDNEIDVKNADKFIEEYLENFGETTAAYFDQSSPNFAENLQEFQQVIHEFLILKLQSFYTFEDKEVLNKKVEKFLEEFKTAMFAKHALFQENTIQLKAEEEAKDTIIQKNQEEMKKKEELLELSSVDLKKSELYIVYLKQEMRQTQYVYSEEINRKNYECEKSLKRSAASCLVDKEQLKVEMTQVQVNHAQAMNTQISDSNAVIEKLNANLTSTIKQNEKVLKQNKMEIKQYKDSLERSKLDVKMATYKRYQMLHQTLLKNLAEKEKVRVEFFEAVADIHGKIASLATDKNANSEILQLLQGFKEFHFAALSKNKLELKLAKESEKKLGEDVEQEKSDLENAVGDMINSKNEEIKKLEENLETVENENKQQAKSIKVCERSKKLKEIFNKIGHWSEFSFIWF